MNILEQKNSLHDTEEELLADLVQSELEAVWNRIEVARRGLRNLTIDESAQIALGSFDTYVAGLGVEHGNTREEFVRSMGEAFDAITAESSEEEHAG